MSDSTVDSLKKQLEDKIAALDKQRQEDTLQRTKEVEEKRLIEEAERADKLKKIREQQVEHMRRKEQERLDIELKVQKETEVRLGLERKQNETEELNRKLREKLEYIQNEISKAEFVEEQYRKARDSGDAKPAQVEESAEISVEHPVAPLNVAAPGEAVEGTGGLEVGPNMSQHLKQILRQASRSY